MKWIALAVSFLFVGLCFAENRFVRDNDIVRWEKVWYWNGTGEEKVDVIDSFTEEGIDEMIDVVQTEITWLTDLRCEEHQPPYILNWIDRQLEKKQNRLNKLQQLKDLFSE